MVDYSTALPQQQYFQAPDLMQNAMRMQQMQAQAMQMQALARKSASDRDTRQLYADPNFDPFSREGARQLSLKGGPEVGFAAVAAARQNENLQRQTALTNAGLEKTRLEIGAKEYDVAQDRLAAIRPGDAKGYAEWDRVHGPAYRANGVNLPTPEEWAQDPEGKLQGHMVSTSQSVRERAAKREEAGQFNVQMTEAGPVATNKLGQYRMATQLPGDGAPVAGAGAPAVGGAPVARAGAPAAGGEAGYLTGLNRAEGTAKNPYSSAEGKFQFINSTFVDTARKTFPGLADKSPTEILALRGQKLPDGRQIEDVLEQTLRANNTQALVSAGIAPTPGNTYLAHFLGAGGARSLLSVDPNTPVSQILDPRAIAANKSVLEGKTAGQVAAWADRKFGGSPGLAASMTAGNQRQGGVGAPSFTPAMGGGMSPTAPTMNNAMALGLMGQQPPQQGNALAMQPVPVTTAQPQAAPAPSTYEEAQRAADQRKLAVKRIEESDKAAVKLESTEAERRQNAKQALSLVADPNIENLIKGSTAGLLQRGGAALYEGATGRSTTGAISSGKLDMLANKLTLDLSGGKLGAGISNEDRSFLQKTIGDIANRNTGIDERLGSLAQLKEMLSAMSEGKPMRVVPTETEEPTPRRRGNVTPPTRALNAMDQQALAWAKANPNDPRAGAINERLGAR